MLTTKEIYDLDNRNVASQNVKLGSQLSAIENSTALPYAELTTKQIYDLNNENHVAQQVSLGTILDALTSGDIGAIQQLTEAQQAQLSNMDVACQNCDFGTYLEGLIESAQTQYTLTVESNDATKGTVVGGGNYIEGATATLTATATDGNSFAYWILPDSSHIETNPYNYTMPASNETITGYFIVQE